MKNLMNEENIMMAALVFNDLREPMIKASPLQKYMDMKGNNCKVFSIITR